MTEGAVLLIRRRRLVGEAEGLGPTSIRGIGQLRGTKGAGRVLGSLAELGLHHGTVSQAVADPDLSRGDIDAFDAGRQFVTVILGSHLVNTPDEAVRGAWLRAARRHLVGDGHVLAEHHPVDWAETAAEVPATPGGAPGMVDVRIDTPFVSAVSVYDVGGRQLRQPFTARVLSNEELERELDAAGLQMQRRLSATWLLAGPA